MKYSVLLLCSLLFSLPALADCPGGNEAQGFFIVNSAKLNANQQCVVNLQIDWSKGDYAFRENPNCPLDSGEIQNADLIGPLTFASSGGDVACDWKAGQRMSGILVLNNNRVHLE